MGVDETSQTHDFRALVQFVEILLVAALTIAVAVALGTVVLT